MGRSMWTLFNAAMGTYDEDTYLAADAPSGAISFFILYTFVISIILFNLLITLLMDAYQQVRAARFSKLKAQDSPLIGHMGIVRCVCWRGLRERGGRGL
jgi:Ion transport protein